MQKFVGMILIAAAIIISVLLFSLNPGTPLPPSDKARAPENLPVSKNDKPADKPDPFAGISKFVVSEYLLPEVEAKLEKYGAQKAYFIYQGGFDADDDGNFNPEQLAAWPTPGHPEIPADFSGIISIDWEGKMMDRIKLRDTKAISEYQKCIAAVRQRWPKAKITAYGMPLFEYWKPPEFNKLSVAEDWLELAKFSAPITDALDLFCQQVYDYYGGNDENDHLYFAERVRLCKQLRPDQKISVIFMSRYHEGGSPDPGGQIPAAELAGNIQAALKAGADCVIQWGSDADMFNYARAFPKLAKDDPNYAAYKVNYDAVNKSLPAGWTIDQYMRWSQERIIAVMSSAVYGDKCEFGEKPE